MTPPPTPPAPPPKKKQRLKKKQQIQYLKEMKGCTTPVAMVTGSVTLGRSFLSFFLSFLLSFSFFGFAYFDFLGHSFSRPPLAIHFPKVLDTTHNRKQGHVFTGFYWVLPGLSGFFSGFYQVLSSLT